jgi:Cu/Zn superoxide dismutase
MGIDPACSGGEAGNRCGIHIHEGKSCSEDAKGPLYDVKDDPWVAAANGTKGGVYYRATNGSQGSVSDALVKVVTNLTASDILGRAVIVHDSTSPGRRIACALLTTPPTTTTTTLLPVTRFIATNFVKYVNSTTNFSVSGSVTVTQVSSLVPSQLVSWNLVGIDPACNSSGGEAGNMCGIHIHVGRSCSEDAEGHLKNVKDDPWVATSLKNGTKGGVYYLANLPGQFGQSESHTSVEVATNLTASDILGRAVIVHDSTPPGRRIACALLTPVPSSASSVGASIVVASILAAIMI